MPGRRRRDGSRSDSSGRQRRDGRRKQLRSRSRDGVLGAGLEGLSPPPAPASEAAKASAPVPDWLADLFPHGSEQNAQATPAKSAVTTSQVEIPLNLIGLLSNDNEAPVRKISSASGAIIQIRQDMQHLGYSLCIMTGTPDSLTKATEMVKQQVGLSNGIVTKEIETAADHVSAHAALELALSEMHKRKAGDVPIKVLPPERAGAKVRVCIGPGPVFLVSMAEQVIRKKLSGVELDLCYRQGRPVPIEMKVAVLCKFYEAGSCSLGAGCQYCHGMQELSLAQRAHLPEGAEIARGLEPANLPRWPPVPGDIRALAPLKEFPECAERPAVATARRRQETRPTSATSGMI